MWRGKKEPRKARIVTVGYQKYEWSHRFSLVAVFCHQECSIQEIMSFAQLWAVPPLPTEPWSLVPFTIPMCVNWFGKCCHTSAGVAHTCDFLAISAARVIKVHKLVVWPAKPFAECIWEVNGELTEVGVVSHRPHQQTGVWRGFTGKPELYRRHYVGFAWSRRVGREPSNTKDFDVLVQRGQCEL